MKIVLLGTAWPYRGGLAVYNERLAHQFQSEGHEVEIYTFTLQYPDFLFPGKTQYSSEPAPTDLAITRRVNSCNPFNWISVGREICRKAPDLLVIKFWLPFMGPCFGTISSLSKRNGKTRVISILDNLIPHESRPGDRPFTWWFCRSVDGFVAMSKSVLDDIDKFKVNVGKPRVFSPHPLYDNFGQPVSREEGCRYLGLDLDCRYFLFFGLIRDYKGLDWLIEAFAAFLREAAADVRLIVAGEFYSDGSKYFELAKQLGVFERIVWKTEFVPDHEVRYYFAAADLVAQPYKSATQSGVTQIAYHFQRPMLVTRVGGLPEIVPDGKVGYVVDPNPKDITTALIRFVTEHPDFSSGLASEREKYSWPVFTKNLISLFDPSKLS
ncbi:MAG: glycosyltransferase [Bacteroidales bacterium]|nr:glycosyltransferase [Bacteroidales bacterium]